MLCVPVHLFSAQAVYPHLATVCWALVMHLFEHDEAVLHPSLTASMQFIYKDR
jgi:hypothetical protein